MVVVIDFSAPGRVTRFRPAWRKCMAVTRRPTSTIEFIGLKATNTIGYYQMMNRASCLSLLSNAVLVYNTLRIGRVLEQAKAQGQAFTLEAMAHISPLARRHVIVNGIYDFSPAHTHHAKEQLCV